MATIDYVKQMAELVGEATVDEIFLQYKYDYMKEHNILGSRFDF